MKQQKKKRMQKQIELRKKINGYVKTLMIISFILGISVGIAISALIAIR